ncbi:MAG: LLM class flavin-dependent oxidoreductase [Acidimicrobiaceae bacterium]|nr:LLM class flavin-dependent oxidoreductase [Acidimicrobiaceae bacterium]
MTTAPVVGLMLATVANLDTGEVEPARVAGAARRAEAAGFDGVYVGDHLLHPHPLLESVVALSVVAASTERIALGPCVMLLGLRDPQFMARQLGTLAAFAPGRLRVGVGVGGDYPAEFEAAGVRLAERGKRMESHLRQVRSLLCSGFGRDDMTGAPIAPDVPFLLGGWKEVSLRRAATLGDGWIGYLLGPDSFARRRSFLMECRDELGLGGGRFTTGMLLPVHVDTSGRGRARAADAWARLTDAKEDFPRRLFIAGRAQEIVEQLHQYWELGCTEFVLGPADQGDRYLEQVDLLGEQVLPAVKTFS